MIHRGNNWDPPAEEPKDGPPECATVAMILVWLGMLIYFGLINYTPAGLLLLWPIGLFVGVIVAYTVDR